jgi:hypothetical protein
MAIALTGTGAMAQDNGAGRPHDLRIRMTIEGQVIAATLLDNPTSRDFASMLPLTVTLSDYASTEKISDLPRKLATDAAPPGSKPSAGMIAYYAPWGNLAVFYNDFAYSRGLIQIGSIDGDLAVLKRSGSLKVKIEQLGQR